VLHAAPTTLTEYLSDPAAVAVSHMRSGARTEFETGIGGQTSASQRSGQASDYLPSSILIALFALSQARNDVYAVP
jgi:hypothetical protein